MLLILALLALSQPLHGPVVRPAPAGGIVQHELSGKVRRPEKPIEQAIVERLKLSDDVRQKVDALLSARAAAIDGFVVRNLLFFNVLETAQAAGSLKERAVTVIEAFRRFDASVGGPPLRDRILAVLPEDQKTTFRAMLREYWRALAQEAAASKPHDPPPPWAVYIGESLASLGREIERSFQRQSESGTLFVDYLTVDLELTPAQQETINGLKLDLMQRTGMKATEKEQQALILGAAAYLNEKQRDKLMDKIFGLQKRQATR